MSLSLDDHENNKERKLSLLLDDGTKIEVNRRYAMIHSAMIHGALENDDATDSIPIRNIARETAQQVVEFMEHHKDEKATIPEKPLQDTDMYKVCRDRWDAEFITQFRNEQIYTLLNASNYLSMNELSHLGAAYIASKIKGQPIENIRAVLQTT